MKLFGLVRFSVLAGSLALATSSIAGVGKTLRVDNNVDNDVDVFVDGAKVGTVKHGEIAGFTVTSTGLTDSELLAIETDGTTYTLSLKEKHVNGYTWGLVEGDGI